MRAAALNPFLFIPHDVRHHDCADLVLRVQRELFHRQVALPGKRPRPLRDADQAEQLQVHVAQLAQPTAAPVDGDLVLMRDAGQTAAGHAGVYFLLDYQAWVLHSSHAIGHSALHRVRDLPGFGLCIEGYYSWI